jgi:uncharacterized membrane protein YhhN
LKTLVLACAVIAGVSYAAASHLTIAPGASVAWKAAGVGLLAVYAALQARDGDGWRLAAVMAFGALGDVVIETNGLLAGGAAFFAGHLTAVWLYLRNRRSPLSAPDRLIGLLLTPAIVALAFLLPLDRARAPQAAAYALGLGAMAAAAWTSRFPRGLTGLGALMFAASDLLLFYRTGRPVAAAPATGLAVWGLYFAGQTLIALGATRGLASEPRAQAEPLAA